MKPLDQILVIGLFVTFAVGYLAGSVHAANAVVALPPSPSVPINYDPLRQALTDALDKQREDTKECWGQVVQLLERGVKP